MKNHWQKDFFSHRVVLDLWRQCISPEQTKREVEFLEKIFGTQTRLLDVPCGNGRHSLELTKRGCQVTGLDISEDFIREAQHNAQAAGLQAEFVHGDMRELDRAGEFDGAFCFGNSFGYFDHPHLGRFLKAVSQALKPGKHFVLDTCMAAESILPNLKDREWMQVGDILFALENRYLAEQSCLETVATFVRNGQTEAHQWWHFVYTVAEIRRLLDQAGLSVENCFSSHDLKPFCLGNPFLLVVAKKTS